MTNTRRTDEATRVKAVADELRRAGFPLVTSDLRRPHGKRELRPDIVSYEAVDGELRPQLVVEVKASFDTHGKHSATLARLALVREALGTSRHYVVVGDKWWRANDALTELTRSQPPTPAVPPTGAVRLADRYLIDSLVSDRLRDLRNQLAHSTRRHSETDLIAALAESTADPFQVGDGVEVVVDRHVLASSIVAAIRELTDRDMQRLGPFSSPAPISAAVVQFLGDLRDGSGIDPFCGLGSFLWTLGEQAEIQNRRLRLRGRDINANAMSVASSIAELLDIHIEFEVMDSLHAAHPHGNYDYVVAAPPWGLRVEAADTAVPLTSAARRRSELLAVACVYEMLAPGGRAVLHLPATILSNQVAADLRAFLTEQCSVLAIVSLPNRAFGVATVDSVLLVFDKTPAPPGHETFVANLAEDWESQLAADGDTMRAYEQYLVSRDGGHGPRHG